MRRDRRSSKRYSFRRKDAADAGTRAFYSPIQTGDRSVRQATCTWVRQQLAVYRPEDTDQTDLERVSRHLETCSTCQRVQVEFQQSGDLIRRLPVLTPPPAFRTAVFAAIRSEAMKQAASVNQISRAVTNPEMPVVTPPTGQSPPPPITSISQPNARGAGRFHLPTALTVAAA